MAVLFSKIDLEKSIDIKGLILKEFLKGALIAIFFKIRGESYFVKYGRNKERLRCFLVLRTRTRITKRIYL